MFVSTTPKASTTPDQNRDYQIKKAALGIGVGVTVAAASLLFVKGWEGERRTPYLDIVGVPTVCFGHTGGTLEMGRTYSQEECERLLVGDMQLHVEVMMRYIKVPLSEGEMTAYSSLVFNIGVNAFSRSTLLGLLNANQRVAACKQLLLWVKAGGKVVRGLQRRRAAEYELCISKPPSRLA